MFARILALALLLTPFTARAEWKEAVSKHFAVYSEGSEAELRKAASDLERYDHLLRMMLHLPDSNPLRVKVYLMRDAAEVQRTMGVGSNTGVAGYYSASARGPTAVGMRKPLGSVQMDFNGQMVLFHEYAHHLMLQYSGAAFPLWYIEGFAEYYAPTKILPNGYEVGHMAPYRRASFKEDGNWLPLKELLTARNYKDIRYRSDLLYAQGWLLIHYLADHEKRSGQLRNYLSLINGGSDYKAAMDAAFGPDAAELDKELRRYSKRQRLEAIRITFPSLELGEVQVRALSPARSALMDREIELARGLFAKDVAEFANDVRKKAQLFPDDPDALGLLAEAERMAGNHDAAIAASERWLAHRPGEPRALMLKGMARIDALVAAQSKDKAAWDGARKWVADARKAAPDDPLILQAFYDSYAADGSLPPPRAQNALFHALGLVPQDEQLRFKVASDFERRGLIEAAIHAIRPAAFAAHDAGDESEKEKAKREKLKEKWRVAGELKSEPPRDMLARLEAKLAAMGGAQAASAPQR